MKRKIQRTKSSQKILEDKKSITETKFIAESFNKYLTQICPYLTKDIGTSTKSFNG